MIIPLKIINFTENNSNNQSIKNTKNNYQTKAKSQEETDDENDFPIRTYGKGELAAKYMPDVQQQTAVNRFNEWIHLCPGLEERLAATGWSLERRKYTPAQVRIIVKAVGTP